MRINKITLFSALNLSQPESYTINFGLANGHWQEKGLLQPVRTVIKKSGQAEGSVSIVTLSQRAIITSPEDTKVDLG